MEVTPLVAEGRQVIQSYRADGFTIGGERYAGSVLVWPTLTQAWAVSSFDEVTEAGLAPLLEAANLPEVLVLGTGATFRMIDPRLRQRLRQRGIVVECMTTAAACRTFNVLLVEDRKVAAALIAVGD
ncbi:MAG TPA: Mth938-like domain-containing protein [Geminicoccus sp.]|uniref:Mth938-like domain-containing protein n=1 Tax=Geminicoccus sp. TaxID=2024832 RepID=UPI002B66ABFD|nr:Mth938-like domain-containing protein [Geminicoccus sp.]HWL68113.1 Mth938-like domain-containing protein [Geminicoccus sp.]